MARDYPTDPPVYADGTPVGAADVAWVGDLPGRVLYFTARGPEWFLTVEQPDRASVTVPARSVHPPTVRPVERATVAAPAGHSAPHDGSRRH